MLDQVLQFYFYGLVLSIVSSALACNYYLSKLGLEANPNKPGLFGIKPFANPITVISNYILTENLSKQHQLNLKRLKNWYLANLILFAGFPVVVLLQILKKWLPEAPFPLNNLAGVTMTNTEASTFSYSSLCNNYFTYVIRL